MGPSIFAEFSICSMKSKGFIRSAQLQRHKRALGDAPSIGRVTKMPGVGAPKSRRKKGSNGDNKRITHGQRSNQIVIRIWSVMLCIATLAFFSAAIWFTLIHNRVFENAVVNHPLDDASKSNRVIARFGSLSQDEGILFVREALAVRDIQRVEEYFRLGSSSTQDVVDYLVNLESQEGKIKGVKWLGNTSGGRRELDEALVIFAGVDDHFKNRLALLTHDSEGKWKIDFEAFTRTVKPSWVDLLGGNANVGEVRIYASNDNYYNGPFKNEQEWSCYGMISPDMEELLIGYCRVGSAQEKAMDRVVSSDVKVARTTLEIRRVKGADKRQFEISKVIAADWVKGDIAYDEAFQ
jgi:hypothetical protein